MSLQIVKTKFTGFGSKSTGDGIYFCVTMEILSKGGIVFYDKKTFEEYERVFFDDSMCYGNVYCVNVKGIKKDTLYRYFNADKEYTDEYSGVVFKDASYGASRKSCDVYSKVIKELSPADDNDVNPLTPYSDSIFYLGNVRALTMLDKSVPKSDRGTFKGLCSKIEYFKSLNISGLILLPCYEFSETDFTDKDISSPINYKLSKNDSPKINLWGFKDSYYFSVKAAYSRSSDPEKEFREMIKLYHANGIEIIMTVYFPDKVKKELISAVLRHYVVNFRVDGFRIQGNNIDSDLIFQDPFLKKTKLMLEDKDINRFYSEKPVKFKNLSLYTHDFQDIARSFLKGDEDRVSSYSYLLRENSRTFEPIRYITDYWGFTLNDLVSYNFKHNEENGENNLDGNNYNFSWNCGIEGVTKKASINKLRLKMAKNALILSFICQGAPVLRGGDEWLDTCFGNNNPWCQDNETGWVKYAKTKTSNEFFEFTKGLLKFRKKHTVLHQPYELKLLDYMSCKLPDISFHSEEPFRMDQDPVSRSFAFLLCGKYAKQYTKKEEDSIYVIFNMYWEEVRFALPVNDLNHEWFKLLCTDGSTDQSFDESKMTSYNEDYYLAPKRSVSIFILKEKESSKKKEK